MKVLIIDAWTPLHIGNAVLLSNTINLAKKGLGPLTQIEISGFLPETIEPYTKLNTCEYLYSTYLQCHIKNKYLRYSINRIIKIEWGLWKLLIKWLFATSKFLQLKFNPLLVTLLVKRRKTVKAYMSADIIISSSGEGINENHGFLDKSIFFYQFSLMLAKKLVFFPQSFGPVFNEKYKQDLVEIFKKCSLVIPRDEFSGKFLIDLGIGNNKQISVVPDVGVLQNYIDDKEVLKGLIDNKHLLENNNRLVGISVSRWVDRNEKGSSTNYINGILEFIDYLLVNGYSILFLPANFPYYKGMKSKQIDETFLKEIYQPLKNEKLGILNKSCTPEEFKGILSMLYAFVTTRMHTSILSTMALTPTITIATQIKLRGFMRNIGQEDYVIDMQEAKGSKIIERFNNVVENRDSIIKSLREKRKFVQKEANKTASLLSKCTQNNNK